MAYLKSSNTLRRIAIVTLVFVCWSTKVPPKMNWINQEFNFALRSYEYRWQTRLSEEETLNWQKQFFKEYLKHWELAPIQLKAALARGETQ